jgi:hypothetical protein
VLRTWQHEDVDAPFRAQRAHSLLGTLGAGGLDLSSSVLGLGDLGDLGLLSLLGLHILDLAGLNLGEGGVVLLVTFVTGLGLLALDLIERHANDSLLDAGGFAGALFSELVNTDFLVEASPCLGPGKLHGLDLLVEHGASLVADEEEESAVLGDVSTAVTGVDLGLGVGTQVSFRNHF